MEPKPLQILLVDDDPNQLETMGDILHAKGFHPVPVRTGAAALSYCETADIDVALIDLHLEDIPGLELLRQLKLKYLSIECILLTGHASQGSAIDAINAGAYSYFQKPCDIDQLVLSIRRAGEKRLAAQALRASEAQYRLLASNISDVIWILDLQTLRFTYVSPSVQALRGYTAEEVLAQDMAAAVTPASHVRIRETASERLEQAKQGHPGPYLDEVEQPRKDGTTVWTETTTHFHFNPESKHWDVYGVSRDITERRRAEDALRESEERFRSLYENATVGMYRTTPDGRILMVNPALLRMLGFDSFEQMAQRNLAEKDYEPQYPRSQFVAAMEKDGQITGLETAWRRQDGGTIFVRESARLIRNAQGQPLYYDGTIEDITERKRAEEKLAEERALLRTLIDNLPDYIYAKDLQGRKILSNIADWQASGGKTMEDVIGKTDFEMYPPELAQGFWAADQAVIETGNPILNLEEPGFDSHGNPVSMLSSKLPLRDARGNIVGLVGVGRDITERKRFEVQRDQERILLRTIIDNFPNSVFVKDKDYKKIIFNSEHVRRVNARIQPVTPLSEEDLLGKTDFEVYPREIAEEYFLVDQKVIEDGQSILDQEVLSADSESRPHWELISKIPLRDANGHIMGMVGIANDITERKQAEESLFEQQQVFRTLVENSPDIIARYDRDCKRIYVNPVYLKVARIPQQNLLDTSPTQLSPLPDAGAAILQNLLRKVLDSGIAEAVDVIWPKTDNIDHWYNIYASPEFDREGRVVSVMTTSRDITERKQAEKALQESEEHFHSLFENMTEGVALHELVLDETGQPVNYRLVDCNPQYERILGNRSADVMDKLATDAYATSDAPYLKEYSQVALSGLSTQFETYFEPLQKHFHISIVPWGKSGFATIFTDITERKQAEAELQASRAAEKNFAERLTVLSETTTELSKAGSLDDLCRRAVEMGRARLDFDRISIWFLAEDHTTMLGTFGVDTEGHITDERKETFTIGPDYPSIPVLEGQTPLLFQADAPLALSGQIVGQGMHVTAGLWDGKAVIGYLSVDNLLRRQPIRERDCEIIRLYASALGHLISLQRTEMELQASQAAEKNFAERLTTLSEATTELSKAGDLDTLCRRTVELGRARLDFDRLAIWFLSDDRTSMRGTFGVDTEGCITDERTGSLILNEDSPSLSVIQGQLPLWHRKDAQLALMGQAVGRGEHITAGLWEGESFIGYIGVDNLLRQRPFSDRDCEIIRLYASALGHLISLKRTEAELQASRAAERDFAGRLAVLSEATTELSKAGDLDALCRKAVELGRERLNLDRLAIWFLMEDRATMLGTFGVDTEGRITDERGQQFPVVPEFTDMPVLQGQVPLLLEKDTPLSLIGQVVGQGMHVSAGLWDGKAVIGYLTADNLLRHQPISDHDCEIIRLYASALGHLISLKRTAQELRASEERYRMLAENMTDTVWLMDLNLKVTYISPSVTRSRGYNLEELNSLPLDQQMAPESFAQVVKMYTQELAPERLAQPDLPISTTLDLEMYRKDGGVFWSANTFTLIRDPQGAPLTILGTARDITESKKAWDALANSEKRFRALIENNTDAVVLVDPRGRVLYESPAYGRMVGRDIQERLGRSSFEFVHPQDRSAVVAVLNELVQSPGRIAQSTFRNRHQDGSWRWFEATATNLLAESAIHAVVINLRDITESKQAEETLANTERIYRQAITNAGGVPYQLDYGSGNYVFLGEGIQTLTGYPPEELTGALFTSRLRQIESYGESGDLPHDQRVKLSRQEGLIPDWREDYLFERKDGALIWLADHSVPVYDSVGKSTGSLGILMDITQRKQAEENIRQRVTELEVLYETGLHISSLMEPKEIGRKVIESLSEKLSWSHASIRLYHPETQHLELLVFNRPGLTDRQLQAETRRLNRTIVRPGQGLSGWVIQHGQPLRLGDVGSDPRFIRTFKGIQSGMYVPMQVGGRTIGVIGVESEQPAAFTEADQRLLTTLAAQAGVAMENARLLAESLRQVEELGALADVSSALRTALTRSEIVAVILDQLMMGLFHNDDACLIAYDPISGGNVFEAARGKWEEWIGLHQPPGEGLGGLLAETRLPFQSDDITREERASQGKTLKRSESVACVPLLVQDQFIGSLWIGRTSKKKTDRPAPFSTDEMRLLGSVADMAANALQRASLHEQALKHADELLAVNNMGRILAETLDLDQIYEKLDESVWQLLGDISLVAIALYDAEKKQLTCVRFNTDTGLVDVATLPPVSLEPPGQGTQSEAIHTRQPVIINDLRERLKKVNFTMDVGPDDGRVTQSGLYVPMLAQGRVVGVMQAQSYTLNRFTQSDAGLLSLVANTAAADIENARLFAETEKRLHNLAALHEIDVAISASVDIHVTLDILLAQTVSELNVDAAAVLLLNPLARTLEYAAIQGFRNHQVKGQHIPLGAGLAGQAALRRQIQSVSDLHEDFSLEDPQKKSIDIYKGEGFMSHHAVPLSAKGQVQGVLEVFLRSPFQPDDEWFSFLETLARQAAIAVDNHTLFDNLQRSNTNIVLAYDATIQGWSQALELRDKETEGHARRVTERTVHLAQLVGVPVAELEHVRRGTLLHDIGKMGIPDAILLKPGKLTEQEWVIMRRHPVLAYEMLSSIAYLRPALDIPHYHHEKWDGSGYPDGLKGEQIPLYARIFAIVDVYDALTNDRPYRPAWTAAKAIEYLRAESGKHFDPAIVEAFLNMLAREN